MYYHGTKKCETSPNAHEDKHTFWVYDKSHARGFIAKWDTVIPAHKYCNNHIIDGPLMSWPRKYVCLGHTEKKDMLEAETEWASLGLDNRDYFFSSDPYKPPKPKMETFISLPPPPPPPAPPSELTIPTEIQSMKECLNLIETKVEALRRPFESESMKECLNLIETKVEALRRPVESESMKEELESIKEQLNLIETKIEALRRPVESESMKEELQCLETKMKFLDKAMFWSFIILCFILYYSLYSKKPTYELEISSRELDI